MSKLKKSKSSTGGIRSTKTHTLSPSSSLPLRNLYLFLFLFACALYINTLHHQFAFDDSVVITGNKYTKEGFAGIKTLATKDLFFGIYGNSLDLEGGRWRPLTLILFAIEYQLFGDNPTPFHAINILLYGLTAIVLFMTLLQLLSTTSISGKSVQNIIGRDRGIGILALTTTILFIAHPIHTEVVANIKSRDEIVSFLFLCMTLLFLFKQVGSTLSSIKITGIACICYFLALLSKENGITFLAVIPLSLICFAEKNLKQSLTISIPYIITAVIYVAIRTSMVGFIGDRVSNDLTDNPFMTFNFSTVPVPLPFMEKFATVCWILLKYLFLLIFPHPLSSDYSFNQIPAIGITNPKALISILIYSGLFIWALLTIFKQNQSQTTQTNNVSPDNQRRLSFPPLALKNILAFSILYYLATISVVSNLFFLIGTNMGERFIYTTSLGFCLALAAIILKLTNTEKLELKKETLQNPRLLAGVLILVIPYSIKTINRNPAWKDNKALFTTDVKSSTGSANLHYYYANTIFTEHMNDLQTPERDSIFLEAKKEFRKALAINPYFHYCYYNLGLIYEKFNQPDSAIFYHEKVIALKPENTMVKYMAKGAMGLVYGKLKGDVDRAIPLLKEALANSPNDPGYHENLGICYAMKQNYGAAIIEFESAIRSKPIIKKEDAHLYMNYAISLQGKGEQQKADEYFNRAFQLDPSLKKQ